MKKSLIKNNRVLGMLYKVAFLLLMAISLTTGLSAQEEGDFKAIVEDLKIHFIEVYTDGALTDEESLSLDKKISSIIKHVHTMKHDEQMSEESSTVLQTMLGELKYYNTPDYPKNQEHTDGEQNIRNGSHVLKRLIFKKFPSSKTRIVSLSSESHYSLLVNTKDEISKDLELTSAEQELLMKALVNSKLTKADLNDFVEIMNDLARKGKEGPSHGNNNPNGTMDTEGGGDVEVNFVLENMAPYLNDKLTPIVKLIHEFLREDMIFVATQLFTPLVGSNYMSQEVLDMYLELDFASLQTLLSVYTAASMNLAFVKSRKMLVDKMNGYWPEPSKFPLLQVGKGFSTYKLSELVVNSILLGKPMIASFVMFGLSIEREIVRKYTVSPTVYTAEMTGAFFANNPLIQSVLITTFDVLFRFVPGYSVAVDGWTKTSVLETVASASFFGGIAYKAYAGVKTIGRTGLAIGSVIMGSSAGVSAVYSYEFFAQGIGLLKNGQYTKGSAILAYAVFTGAVAYMTRNSLAKSINSFNARVGSKARLVPDLNFKFLKSSNAVSQFKKTYDSAKEAVINLHQAMIERGVFKNLSDLSHFQENLAKAIRVHDMKSYVNAKFPKAGVGVNNNELFDEMGKLPKLFAFEKKGINNLVSQGKVKKWSLYLPDGSVKTTAFQYLESSIDFQVKNATAIVKSSKEVSNDIRLAIGRIELLTGQLKKKTYMFPKEMDWIDDIVKEAKNKIHNLDSSKISPWL